MKRIETLLKDLLRSNPVGRIAVKETKDNSKMFATYRVTDSFVERTFKGRGQTSFQAEIILFGKSTSLERDIDEMLALSQEISKRLFSDVSAESLQIYEDYDKTMKRPFVRFLFNFKGEQWQSTSP